MQGRREIEHLLRVISLPPQTSIQGIEGHAETAQFAARWRELVGCRVIVTSAQGMLLAFAHGLVRMERLGALIFDDCTLANHGHPFCVIMECFWMPLLLAKNNWSDELEFSILPRVIGFAGWPQERAEESFLVKRSRTLKLQQYHRLFHACLLPYEPEGHDERGGWLAREEIFSLGQGQDALPEALGRLHLVHGEGGLPPQGLIITRESWSVDQMEAMLKDKGQMDVVVYPPAEANPELDLLISLTLLAHSTSTGAHVHLVTKDVTRFAREVAIWLSGPLVYSAVGSNTHRQLKSFFSSFSALHQNTLGLLLPHSPLHWRLESTGALVTTATALPILQSICATLPKLGVAGLSPTLRLHTMAIKRVNGEGKYLDTNRHFYSCRITLPAFLRNILPIVSSQLDGAEYRAEGISPALDVIGPLCASRHQAQVTAAIKVLRLLHEHGCIDDNLLPCLEIETMEVGSEEMGLAAEPRERGVSPPAADEQKDEAMASAMMLNDQWHGLFSQPQGKLLHMYAIVGQLEERTDCSVPAEHPPPDTLCHLAEYDWLHPVSAGHSLALLSPTRWPVDQLMPMEISVGVRFFMNIRLVEQEPVCLDAERLEILMGCQNIFFGTINLKQLTKLDDIEAADDLGNGEGEEEVPADKTMVYLVGLAKKSDAAPLNCHEMNAVWDRYQRFKQLSKEPLSIYQPRPFDDGQWVLDWETMAQMIRLEEHETLKQYMDRVTVQAVEDGDPPIFDRSYKPGKEPLCYDFRLYSLRRLLLHMPVNGLFYRVKKLQPDLNPFSPFASKAYPTVTSYAEYMQVRYGLPEPAREQPMVAVKRVENYASHAHWVCRTGDDRRQQTNRQRQQQLQMLQREQRKHPSVMDDTPVSDLVEAIGTFAAGHAEMEDEALEQQQEQLQEHQQMKARSVLIPEYVRIVPVPYALCRLMLMIPRIAFDVQKQLLCLDFYKQRIPPSLHSAIPSLPIQVESLTGPASAMRLDYERMEVLGDSILKYAATISCFLQYRTEGEGRLSSLRQEIISNANLYRVGMEKLSIHRYARLTPFFPKLWTPPDLHCLIRKHLPNLEQDWPFTLSLFGDGHERWQRIRAADQRAEQRQTIYCWYPDGRIRMAKGDDSRPLMAVSQNRGPNKRKHKMQPLSRHGQSIPPKTIADLVEACIASFYLGPGGLPAAIQFLIEMGMVNADYLLNLSSQQGMHAAGCIVGSTVAEERPQHLPQPASLGTKISRMLIF